MNSEELSLLTEKIRSLDKALVIFICGMQATRKSTTAIQVAAKLGFKEVVHTDLVRDNLRIHVKDPFLRRSTHRCWKLLGKRTPENIIKGYLKQSRLVKRDILNNLKLARRGENIIFEGVHLAPELYYSLINDSEINFCHFLFCVEDEKMHQANIKLKIELRHGRETKWQKYNRKAILEIQKYLMRTRPDRVHLIHSTTPEENVEKILGELSCRLMN